MRVLHEADVGPVDGVKTRSQQRRPAVETGNAARSRKEHAITGGRDVTQMLPIDLFCLKRSFK